MRSKGNFYIRMADRRRTSPVSSVGITEDEIKNFEQIYIVACGSAWVRCMNNLENRAAEIVKAELIYTFERR